MEIKEVLFSGKSKSGRPIEYVLIDPMNFYYSYPTDNTKVKHVIKHYKKDLGEEANLVALIANFTVSIAYSHRSGSFYNPSILYWDGSSISELSEGVLELPVSHGFKTSMRKYRVYFYITFSPFFDGLWNAKRRRVKAIRSSWLPLVGPNNKSLCYSAFETMFEGFYSSGSASSIRNFSIQDLFSKHFYSSSFEHQKDKIVQEAEVKGKRIFFWYPLKRPSWNQEEQKDAFEKASFMVNELKKEDFFPSLVYQLDALFSKVDGLHLKAYAKEGEWGREGKSEFYFPLDDSSSPNLRLVVFIFPSLIIFEDLNTKGREIAYLSFSSASLLLVAKPEKYLQFGEGVIRVEIGKEQKEKLEAWGESKGVPKRTLDRIDQFVREFFRFVVFPKDKIGEITGGLGKAVVEIRERVLLEKVPKSEPRSKPKRKVEEEERKEVEEVTLSVRRWIDGPVFSIFSKIFRQRRNEIRSEEGSDFGTFYSAMIKARELMRELGEEGEKSLVSSSVVGDLCVPSPGASRDSKLILPTILKEPAYLIHLVANEELMKRYREMSEYDYIYKYCERLTECFLREFIARDPASLLHYLTNGGGKVSLNVSNQIYVWEDKGGEKTFSRSSYLEAIFPIEEYDNLVISLSVRFPV